MTGLDRRAFLRRGAGVVGGLAIAGPLQAYAANSALGAPARSRGYGELRDRGALRLPEGFRYRIISRQGEPMSDGNPTPGIFDGMAAFPGRDGSVVLIRNHENRRSSGFPGSQSETAVRVPAGKRYDALPVFNAGCTKLVVGPGRRVTESFAVLGGTTTNCAGGPTPWRSWITCEEVFEDGEERHGYAYEVDSRARGPVRPEPIRAAGRFFHEAVSYLDGTLYLTEDNITTDVAFYRYVPDSRPRRAGDLARSRGQLQALKVAGERNFDFTEGVPVGRPFNVRWVDIPEPDPPADTVRFQAQASGAALFRREEGTWVGNGKVYFTSTDGGDAEEGQVFEFDPRRQTITLIYESPGQRRLSGPDNMVVAPTRDLFICEDSEEPQFVRGLTPSGRIYDFARSVTNDSEFCGACFSPSGRTLFVNQQGDRGRNADRAVTYAIWGPFGSRAGLEGQGGTPPPPPSGGTNNGSTLCQQNTTGDANCRIEQG